MCLLGGRDDEQALVCLCNRDYFCLTLVQYTTLPLRWFSHAHLARCPGSCRAHTFYYLQALVWLSNREILDASRGRPFNRKMTNSRVFL